MMNRRTVLAGLVLSTALGGCSTFKKLTGQRNDTVLPGQREEVLTPDQYTAKNEDLNAPPAGGGTDAPAPDETVLADPQTADACNPDIDPECVPANPKETANKGIFDDN